MKALNKLLKLFWAYQDINLGFTHLPSGKTNGVFISIHSYHF